MEKKRILIVDDDIPLTKMVKINLEETGRYLVRVENQSTAALTAAREFNPDLIFLDYIMPGMDGGDVSSRLHEDPHLKGVPIIMITALVSNSETGDLGMVMRGGHMMVAKPIKMANLLRCIEKRLMEAA